MNGNVTHTSTINTFGLYPKENLTMEDVREAVKNIHPIKKQRIEVCKKHWILLKKQLQEAVPQNGPWGDLASMYGIPVTIRPYLKKIRIYTEK